MHWGRGNIFDWVVKERLSEEVIADLNDEEEPSKRISGGKNIPSRGIVSAKALI